jgi:hypothetical protein
MNEKAASLEIKPGFGATERKDIWWLEWVLLGSALAVFLSYGMWAALQGKNYIVGPYRSPFYPFDFHLGKISPALFIFWIPAFFRMTCYYMRKVYYRSYLTDPPSCAVKGIRSGYGGETGFPFILLNLHRYVVYLAVLLLIWHWKETLAAFYYQGKLGIGLGGVLLVLDSIFLTFYIFSCHTIRHMVGGGINQFSCSLCSRLRHKAWKAISRINYRHGFWAWVSLISIIIADVYIRLLAAGVITDINTWGLF